MKLQYLGTAAAEGFPGMFCGCAACERARKAGGKNIRTRSQAVIDDSLLIDFPADTYHHVLTHGLALEKIQHCIVTHSHSDHFYPADLEMRNAGFAHLQKKTAFNIYGWTDVYEKTKETITRCAMNERVVAHLIKPFETFSVGNYSITPLPACHDSKSSGVIYAISDKKSTLLYAHDTGMLREEVWKWLENSGMYFDLVSLDCTGGILIGWEIGHMGIDTCCKFADRLKQTGNADDATKFCLNHFSHNCLADYDDIIPYAQKCGFDVSFDGKTVVF